MDITIPAFPGNPLKLPPLTLGNIADPSNRDRLVANPVPAERLAVGDILAIQGRVYVIVTKAIPDIRIKGLSFVRIGVSDHDGNPLPRDSFSIPADMPLTRVTRGTEGEPVVLNIVNPEA